MFSPLSPVYHALQIVFSPESAKASHVMVAKHLPPLGRIRYNKGTLDI